MQMPATINPRGLTKDERKIVLLVSAIQFINILDFMMVMPLGPDFATALDIPTNRIGLVGGAYTAAACVSSFLGSLYLDRLERRRALGIAMTGLVFATAMGGLSLGFDTLLIARILAGLFRGPASSLALAIIADAVVPERRGRAMGMVNGAFSAASVMGVPIGLKLAQWGGWRVPFFAVAFLGFLMVFAAIKIMKPQREHLTGMPRASLKTRWSDLRRIMKRWPTRVAFLTAFVALAGNFLLIPNLSAYFQFNLGYPRGGLSLLYACGGLLSFFSSRFVGILVDRIGGFRVSVVLIAVLTVVYYLLFMNYDPAIPVIVLFSLFMMLNTGRYVVVTTTVSKIPPPHERAGFMSLMTAVQNLGTSTGALVSSAFLIEGAGGSLTNISQLAWIATGMAVTVPLFIWWLETHLKRRSDPEIEKALETTAID
jgi:predicted MFS family arabinose efflux permease